MLTPDDRVLILAPHPDDEVLGCGGIILQAVKMGLPIKVVFFTYGDSNEWSFLIYRKYPAVTPKQIQGMGLLRHDEAIKATNLLGLSSDQLIFLGYPDFGTLNIWYYHWRQQSALRSMFTRVQEVPYDNAFRSGALYKGEEILKDLKTIIKNFRPTKVFFSHRTDFNGDHQALHLFTRVALWDLEKELKPRIYPFLIHFEGWPYPRFYRPFEPLNPPKKLEEKINWKTYPLSKDEIKTKYEALKAHKTQFVSNSKYLLSFIKMNELFGGYDMLLANECCSTRQIEEGCIRSIVPVGEISEDEHSEDEQSVYHAIKETSICLVNDILTLSINLSSVNGKKLDIGRKMECKDIDGGRTIREGVLPLKQKSFFPPIHGCGASFHIFSYRNDRPFETMPKVQITVHRNYYSIFGLAEIPEPVEVVREASKLTVNVPLRLLKNPHKILINVRKFIGTVTLQLCFLSRRCFWIPWRIIGIE